MGEKYPQDNDDGKSVSTNRRCQPHMYVCVCEFSEPKRNSNSIRFYCNQIGVWVKVKWNINSLSLLHKLEYCKYTIQITLEYPKMNYQMKYPMSNSPHPIECVFISVSIYQRNNSVAFYMVHLVGIFCRWVFFFSPSRHRFLIAVGWLFNQISGKQKAINTIRVNEEGGRGNHNNACLNRLLLHLAIFSLHRYYHNHHYYYFRMECRMCRHIEIEFGARHTMTLNNMLQLQ